MESQSGPSRGSRVEPWIALFLCAAVLAARAAEPLVSSRPGYAGSFAPHWLALAAAVVLARLVLARPAVPESTRAAAWYGYAAFVLALPYPVLRTSWALGGTIGLSWPGAAGHGWIPWLACIPWLLAAALSLLLASTWRWMPRRLLMAAGWFATAAVALIGPAACWSLAKHVAVGGGLGPPGIATWIPGLFYGSWLLWAVAAGAATRSYQLRSAAVP